MQSRPAPSPTPDSDFDLRLELAVGLAWRSLRPSSVRTAASDLDGPLCSGGLHRRFPAVGVPIPFPGT